MFFNKQNQQIFLSEKQMAVCRDGQKFQEMKEKGKPINTIMKLTIQERIRIMFPLIEKKIPKDPIGSTLKGAFSIGTRMKFIQ